MAIEDFDQVTIAPAKLRPFSKFVMSIGELPTSYLDSLSYAEQVTWFCDYLQNNVIPALNNNAAALQEVQNLMTQLQEYVDNYFTNLDVQEEINNKLDQMAEDGTLTNLIGSYIDPLIAAQNTEISTFKNTVNNELDLMDTKIDSVTSGSPLVASSTAGMTDTTRVYVNTTDGKWYYYDGTNWTAGGTYQATAAGANSVGRSAINYSLTGDLFNTLGNINKKINVSYNSSNTTLTVSTDTASYFNNGNGFYTIGAQSVSETLDGNVCYIILDVSSTPTLQLIKNPAILSATNKGNYYTLGYIYNTVFHALMDKSHFIVSGLKVQQNNVSITSDRTSYIKLNNTANSIEFYHIYVLENGVINTQNITLTTDSLESLHYIIWDGSSVAIKGANELIDFNRVLFTIYQNQIFGADNIRVINSSKLPAELGNVILGDINVSFTDMKIYINNIYLALPGTSANIYANTSNVIEIDIPDTSNVYNLYFIPQLNTFELLKNQQNRETSGKWWILSIYGTTVYPMIDAAKIKVNNIPFYETVVNIQTNTALELSMNDIFKSLADKTNQTKITIVGDSIAHGVGGTGFDQNGDTIITSGGTTWKRNPDGYCWANIFKDYIEDNYNATVTNNACTGTNTTFLKNNISTLIPSNTDIVIICYGTNNRGLAANDNYNSVYTTTVNDFNTIIAYCNTNNIKYCICSPVPSSTADEERVDGDTSRFVHLFQINNIIKSIASTQKCEYANMYNAINEYCRLTNTTWTNCLADGLHPNDTGYKIMYYEYMYQFGLAPSYEEVQ